MTDTVKYLLTIPVGMWILSDSIPRSELDPKDFKRAVALPFLTDGHIPEEKNKTIEEDTHGLREVIVLLFRSWPFVRPYFLGRWYTRSEGTSQEVADPLAGDGYGLIYAPVLATGVAILGPLLGLIDIELGSAEWERLGTITSSPCPIPRPFIPVINAAVALQNATA